MSLMKRVGRVSALLIGGAVLSGLIFFFSAERKELSLDGARIQDHLLQRFRMEANLLDALSYQFIANQDLNDAMYSYGRRSNTYDVALYNLSFTRHLESQRSAAALLDEAFFFDFDDLERIPLTMTEDFLRPEAAAVRRTVWGPVSEAAGQYLWLDAPISVHGGSYLTGGRLIKRLKTGEPIGLLAFLVSSERIALIMAQALSALPETPPDLAALLVSPTGAVIASLGASYAGLPVSEALGASSYFESIMAQGLESGTLFVAAAGRRRPAAFSRVSAGGPYLVTVFPAEGFSPIARRILFSVLLGLFVFAVLRSTLRVLGLPGKRRAPRAAAGLPDGACELPEDLPPMSDRERLLLRLLCRGLSNKEIAWELGVKEQTVKNYLRRIYEKIGVHDRVSALLLLRRGEGRAAGGSST